MDIKHEQFIKNVDEYQKKAIPGFTLIFRKA